MEQLRPVMMDAVVQLSFHSWVAVAAPLQRCFPWYEAFAFHVVEPLHSWTEARG
jgi:hypothetical protein